MSERIHQLRRCENCVWFKRIDAAGRVPTIGECRKGSPVVAASRYVAGVYTMFPEMAADGYCGEFAIEDPMTTSPACPGGWPCGLEAVDTPKGCPYAEEIHGREKPCRCCDGCRQSCADSI